MATPVDFKRTLGRLKFTSKVDKLDDVEVFTSPNGQVSMRVFGDGDWWLEWEEVRKKGRGLPSLLRALKGFQTESKGIRETIKELVEDEIEEMTSTGDAQGFGTPKAFDPDEESSLDEQFERVVAGMNEAKNPEWEYKDGRGVTHHGHVQQTSDRGGTDVTYFFIDKDSGELTLINGPRLKTHAKRVHGVSSEPHKKYWLKKEAMNEAKGGTPFKCNDCGKKFKASLLNFGDRNCPKCGSPDTDLVKTNVKEASMGAHVWSSELHGATTFDSLKKGDKFSFPKSDAVHTKKSDTSYTSSNGKTFKTGKGSSVIREGGDPYYAWRNDETTSPKMKIGKAISEINKQLTEMSKVVKRSARLKTEMGVPNSDLWKRTNASLMKIEQRMTGIAQQIRGMRG